MALPLKTGADLYNQQLIRARLQNLGAQPNTADVGLGQVYFNTGTNTAASLRIGYCYETGSVPKFHHVANLEDVNRLEELISALSGSSSESVASVLGRVITLEGYFSNGKAKDADLLDGHNSDYFAEAATLNDLLEDYEAFKAVFADNSDDYINTWTEVKNFLDGIKNTEDLNAILLGINTELGKKANKATTLAGYGIIDAVLKQDYINLNDLATTHAQVMGYGNPDGGWKTYSSGILSKVHDAGFALQGGVGALFFRGIGGSVWEENWHEVLHTGNYSDLITDLNNNLNVKGSIYANYAVSISRSTLVGQLLGGNEDYTYVGRTKSGVWEKDIFKFYANDDNYAYGNFIFEKQINSANGIKIGNAILSWDEDAQALKINTNVYSDGQVSSGGIGSEGSGSGASGIVILEDWEKYDDTLAQVLGAGLGVGLRDKIAALESKATKVSVSGLLESGKPIGTIKVDDTSYNLLAPDDYLPLSGGVIKGSLEKRLPTEGATQNYIIFTRHNGTAQGYLGFNGVDNPIYIPSAANAIYSLLHEGNYESIVGNKFLKLSGGTVNGLVTVKRDAAVPFYLINEGNFQSSWVALRFGIGSTYKSSIGASTSKNGLVRLNSDLTQEYEILDEGNFNSYAPTLTGVGASGTWGIDISGRARGLYKVALEENFDLNTKLSGGGIVSNYVSASYFVNKPSGFTYGSVLQIASAYLATSGLQPNQLSGQLAWDINHGSTTNTTKHLWWRATGDGSYEYSKWRQLAFTDSDITGNAAGLKHSNGTQALIVDANGYLEATQSIRNAGDSWYLGSILKALGRTDLKGGMLYSYSDPLYFGNKGEIRMLINSSGNVTLGSSDLAGADYRLYVNGKLRAQRINIEGSNEINAVDDSGSPIALCLNWSSAGNVILAQGGGNVAIGTGNAPYKFNVAGQIHATGQIYSDIGFILRTTDDKGTRASFSHSSNTLYIQSGYNDGSSTAGNMMISGVNTANLASLDVKASKSTFNGRLLVNGATDDGTTALQISGDGTVGHGIKISNGWSSASFGSYSSGYYARTGGWANGLYQYSSSGDILGGLEYDGRYEELKSIRFMYGTNAILALTQTEATINGDLKVTGNIIADGQVSSGGVAEAGTGGATGGSGLDRVVFTIPTQTTSFTCEHNLGTREISVAIYEEGNDYQQVLTDVYLDSTNIARVVFGSATDVVHKVVIIG